MLTVFKRHRLLATAFVVACLLSVLLIGKIAYDIYDHRVTPHQSVAGWMTVGYIGKSWGFDPREIDKRAGLPLPINGELKTLNQTAKERNVPVEELVADVERVLAEMKSEAVQ